MKEGKWVDEYDQLWRWIAQRGCITVQEYNELKHIYNLMRECDCQSYLEVGTAEGNSLYVLGHAVDGTIDYIDLGEAHTLEARKTVVDAIRGERHIGEFLGDSTNPATWSKRSGYWDYKYDCILIDGGHDFATVLSDSILYAPLATKYIFWHDIQLPEVRAAYEWFKKRWALGEYSEFINSDSFGYGILKVKR